jgi:rRNA maturation RNase YbeY
MTAHCQVFATISGRFPRREAAELADLILHGERRRLPANIILADDATLLDLNSRFRKKNRPTDVLSFPAGREMGVIGDIYISIDTAKRQADELGWSLREEILRLVCHGVLHLCGYDHHRKDDAVVMKAKEKKYLDRYDTVS